MTRALIPLSTYRVQFNKDFRFVDCRDIVPYLHMLGIGALYSSPRFRARRGSEHGYDVASPLRVNSEVGTDEEFAELCTKLSDYALGLVLDIVPNHMAASHENPWWMDVLENGRSSPYAHYFDIEWHPTVSKAAFLPDNRVLLPILGDLYGNVLERGELTLGVDETGFFLRYYDHKTPLDPASYEDILEVWLNQLASEHPQQGEVIDELENVRLLVRGIPPNSTTDSEQIAPRLNEGRKAKQRIFEVYRDYPEARTAFDATMRRIGEEPERLHALLEKQAFRLAFWKMAHEEINYRRFFDINDLVCLRVEEEDVFAARHHVIIQLIAEKKVTGLRVDHIDGLYDPETYLEQLQSAAANAASQPVYSVVEKILGRDECLPRTWKTCGTTGYDFLNAVNGIMVEAEGLRSIEATYARFTGSKESFADVSYTRNKQVMRELFAAEVQALGNRLGRLAAQDPKARDVPLSQIIAAMVEITACLRVYRTYIRSFDVSRTDRSTLEQTLECARRRSSTDEIGDPAFEFLRRVLLLEPIPPHDKTREEYLTFVRRWQQFSGPVIAKGLEDTAGYVHNSLISVNEVGGDSQRERPPMDAAEFHQFLQNRLRHWPHTMNATSTHDTKRSEDVRARINVLSEFPQEWEKCLARWSKLNRRHKTEVDGIEVPTPAEESLLYQTLLGAWPFDASEEHAFLERVQQFLTKAVREAKVYSRWTQQNEPHEKAWLSFAAEIFNSSAGSFRQEFLRFQRKIAWHGALNSLSQLLIKITAPGVPDFYQGSELWDLSLVDPDNRRPVDFRKRIQMLEDLRKEQSARPRRLLREILTGWRDGRVKLYVTDKALEFRRLRASVYEDGDYLPLDCCGVWQSNVFAFARKKKEHWCLTIVPRFTTRLAPSGRMPLGSTVWQDTFISLPDHAPQSWQSMLTSDKISAGSETGGKRALRLSDILDHFPVALLEANS
ncbi:MAG TPA: malto-oligosyltrehalose synthase [Terracidiphilus sp.]|nr:malto-oligosyltrehalose synthase [Terracidiphilus sp.]